jgi:flavin-dependent dehydrogenase
MNETTRDFDVAIVGGRIAGSSLAIRLSRAGRRVLLLEQDKLPSLPALSCPAIFPGAMALMEELGISDRIYAANTPAIPRFVLEVREHYTTETRFPDFCGRSHVFAIDRGRFDDALWTAATASRHVLGLQRFRVTDLIWNRDEVVGVRGCDGDGVPTSFTARCVVGADGAGSVVAKRAGAVTVAKARYPTALHYAYWRGVAPYDDEGPVVQFCFPCFGRLFMVMDSADGGTGILVNGPAGKTIAPGEKTSAGYLRLLQETPQVWRRLYHAEMQTPVRGIARFTGLTRQTHGPGWVLVGDAWQRSDPFDSQGAYDALFASKHLAEALLWVLDGRMSWEAALGSYRDVVCESAFPMREVTERRIRWEMYTNWPPWMIKTIFRWVHNDPEFRRRFAMLYQRAIDPRRWLPRQVVARAIASGLLSDLRQLLWLR